jgi:hypothetical protein
MKTPIVVEQISGEPIPRWAHPAQATAYSGLGTTFLYGLIKTGEITSVRISKNGKARGRALRLIDLRSLDAWIEKHANGGSSL